MIQVHEITPRGSCRHTQKSGLVITCSSKPENFILCTVVVEVIALTSVGQLHASAFRRPTRHPVRTRLTYTHGDIFRLLMVQFELAGARMASCNSSCIHALRCVTVVGTCGASSGALRRGCCYDVWWRLRWWLGRRGGLTCCVSLLYECLQGKPVPTRVFFLLRAIGVLSG